jgi:hypothetical protein
MQCTMPKFSTPQPCTNTLRAPLTKLSHDNIYSHSARTNKIHLALPILHTPRAPLLCVCAPRNAKFSARSRTPTFFHATPKFSVRTHTPTFFRATPKFSARTYTPTFFRAVPKFSARTRTPILFRTTPKFGAHQHANIFPCNAQFYISQDFHYASCIFSAPTCANSFLCAPIPCEFRC